MSLLSAFLLVKAVTEIAQPAAEIASSVATIKRENNLIAHIKRTD